MRREHGAKLAHWLGIGALLLLLACGSKGPQLPLIGADDVVLAFGDSLTYGTGASEADSYPEVLAGLIGRKVVRAGVPGEVTTQGLQRLPGELERHKPKIVLLCLGGNDMLRRVDDKTISANLRAMAELARQSGAAVVLLGVPKPALFGGAAVFYGDLAEELGLVYEESIINTVLRDAALRSDPIHPNGPGYRKIAERIAALLRERGAL